MRLVHHATDRVRAVQHRRRTAHDLHTLQAVHIGDRREFTEVLLAPRVVQPHAVLGEEDALTALPTDHQADLIGTDTGDIDARQVPEYIADAVGIVSAERGGIDDEHRDRRAQYGGLRARRGHANGGELDDLLGGVCLGGVGPLCGQRERGGDECGGDGSRLRGEKEPGGSHGESRGSHARKSIREVSSRGAERGTGAIRTFAPALLRCRMICV